MQYPLIKEYIKAMQDASDNLDKLAYLTPILDNNGEPYHINGDFAVVFKMQDKSTGKYYALKCFTVDQEGRAEAYRKITEELDMVDTSYISSVKYIEKELSVDCQCEENKYPVLLMNWVDGETMDSYLAENYHNQYIMSMLCYRFCKMSAWLRSQSFAHGDVCPSNIIVCSDGSLTLVDYDGMFVPSMKGCKSPTLGTKDFCHPSRTVDDFDETIDDFSLASISLSLKAISMNPLLLDIYCKSGRLLFSEEDYRNPSNSKAISALQELMCDKELCTLYSLFLLALAKKELSQCSFRLFVSEKPILLPSIEDLSTKATEEELKDAYIDEWGVKYSKDGRKLLYSCGLFGKYSIKEGTKIICDEVFCGFCFLDSIKLPESLIIIGNRSFLGCNFVTNIVLPKGIKSIGDHAFRCCSSLTSINLPDGLTNLGDCAFKECESLTSIYIPKSVTHIGEFVFECCSSLTSINIQEGVKSIDWGAFEGCSSLTSIYIPKSVKSIGWGAFEGCSSLTSIEIPKSVTSIGCSAFRDCI